MNDMTPSLADPSEVERKRQLELKSYRDLFERLTQNKVHPVLIFGTSKSGKTHVLQSLFYDAQQQYAERMSASLGEEIFPRGFDKAQERHANAYELLEDGVRLFGRRSKAKQTQVYDPFFVPISLSQSSVGGTPRKTEFAFLESVGEWYGLLGGQADPGGRVKHEYQPLKKEIEKFLKEFNGPLSIIFVAPTATLETRDQFDSDCACLAHVMQTYEKIRAHKEADNILLLVTKWDAAFHPSDPKFGSATGEDVRNHIKGWDRIWNVFSNGITGMRPDAKALMPYAAALFSIDGEITAPTVYEPVLRRFNQVLWNWLYANALESEEIAELGSRARTGATHRAALFPEALPPDPSLVRTGWLGTIFSFQFWS